MDESLLFLASELAPKCAEILYSVDAKTSAGLFRYDAAGQTPSVIESAECKSMEPDVKTSQTLSHPAIVTGGGRGLARPAFLARADIAAPRHGIAVS